MLARAAAYEAAMAQGHIVRAQPVFALMELTCPPMPFHRSPEWSDIGAVERTVLQRAAALLGGHIWRLVIVLHHGELFTPR
jgi:hypothetical protein